MSKKSPKNICSWSNIKFEKELFVGRVIEAFFFLVDPLEQQDVQAVRALVPCASKSVLRWARCAWV